MRDAPAPCAQRWTVYRDAGLSVLKLGRSQDKRGKRNHIPEKGLALLK